MFDFNKDIINASEKAIKQTAGAFRDIDEITECNQKKVLAAFIRGRVSERHFLGTTGYGYGDGGRDTLDKVFAECMGAQDALVRHSFASGTHTLTAALFGLLRPGDTLLSVTGKPYDTICPVMGINGKPGMGSLKDFGINYRQIKLLPCGEPDIDGIGRFLEQNDVKLVYIQRSKGYTLRKSLSTDNIEKISLAVKARSNAIVMVDNCYGEFVETAEPTERGADLIAGSLIKNPGGGLARSGGYIAGKADLVELCSYSMTAPGIGREVGATHGLNRELFQGLFNAPHITGEALKTAVFTAALYKNLGFGVTPEPDEKRACIIQAVKLENEQNLIKFCEGIQAGSPVDSFVAPVPWDMPGYESKVIMAAGAFTGGSSIELSADAPLREPYAAWLQGGLNFHSAKAAVMLAAERVLK